MDAYKRAKAPTPTTGARADAGLFFSGWCREGYWSNGTLLNGRDGRTVNLVKFLCQRPQEAPRATQVLKRIMDSAKLTAEPRKPPELEIPVFMESHL